MSPISESSASFLAATLPISTATKFVLITSILACLAYIVRAISPARLTRVMSSALAATEDSFIQAVEDGSFHCQYVGALAERLASQISLQIDVSILRKATLRDSLSHWTLFLQYFQFRRTLAILRCIQEARAIEANIEVGPSFSYWTECRALSATHFKILKEGQLRELSLEAATAVAARTISMRRRQLSLPSRGSNSCVRSQSTAPRDDRKSTCRFVPRHHSHGSVSGGLGDGGGLHQDVEALRGPVGLAPLSRFGFVSRSVIQLSCFRLRNTLPYPRRTEGIHLFASAAVVQQATSPGGLSSEMRL
ncbi:hypothetical protein B0H11DRAFT_2334249 [Mycena galericulata]|nr:hypothetical protein B0H11DRAFT_2334249 [Mycena galericulata]